MKNKEIKIRKSWGNVNPCQSAHTSKKGKKGYSRRDKHVKPLY